MSSLNKTVVAGGVVYPAGTPATEELRELIDDRHWSEGSSTDQAATAEIAQRDELIKQLAETLEERNARVAELEAEIDQLRAAAGATPAPKPVDYLAKTGKELKAAIDERNADRDPDGAVYIRVEPPGNKSELAAALAADDARAAG